MACRDGVAVRPAVSWMLSFSMRRWRVFNRLDADVEFGRHLLLAWPSAISCSTSTSRELSGHLFSDQFPWSR